MRVLFVTLCCVLVLVLGPRTTHPNAWDNGGVWVDFDGSGHGQFYRGSSNVPEAPCAEHCGGDEERGGSMEPEQKALANRILIWQRQQAARRSLGQLVSDISDIQSTKRRLPAFDEEQRVDISRHSRQIFRVLTTIGVKVPVPRRLASEFTNTYPPFNPMISSYDTVVFLGTFANSKDARDVWAKGNPFTGKSFDPRKDLVIYFGTTGYADLGRAGLDHLMAGLDKLSPETLRRLLALRGKRIRHVIGHSNGATVAEVAFKSGLIDGVEDFRLFGGDRTLEELGYLEQLHRIRSQPVFHVYAMQGDPVPMIPAGWEIRRFAENLTESLTSVPVADSSRAPALFESRGKEDAYIRSHAEAYLVLGVTKTSRRLEGVSVQLFSTPVGWTDWKHNPLGLEYHEYVHYFERTTGMRLQGCLDVADLDRKQCGVIGGRNE